MSMPSRLLNKIAIITGSTDGYGCFDGRVGQAHLFHTLINCILNSYSIGLSIARRMAQEGAKVVISSRKQKNVDKALEALRDEKFDCHGMVCHVSKSEDRSRLISEVNFLDMSFS